TSRRTTDRLVGSSFLRHIGGATLSKYYLNSPGLSKSNQKVVLSAWARSLALDETVLRRANDDPTGSARFEVGAEGDLSDWKPQTATFLQLFNVSILYG